MKEVLKQILGGVAIFAVLSISSLAISGLVGSVVSARSVVFADDPEKAIENLDANDDIYVKYVFKSGDCKCNDKVDTAQIKKKDYEEFKNRPYVHEILEAGPVKKEPSDKISMAEKPDTEASKDAGSTDGAKQSAEGAQDSHVPQNIETKLLSTETGEDGRNYLNVEVSWDADSDVHYNELYPLLLDGRGGAYIIPCESGQTIGDAADVPENVRYTTKDGRNYYYFKIVLLGENEEQIVNSAQGAYATGLREGDTFVIGMTAVVDPQTFEESEMGNGAEATYTTADVEAQKVFK